MCKLCGVSDKEYANAKREMKSMEIDSLVDKSDAAWKTYHDFMDTVKKYESFHS